MDLNQYLKGTARTQLKLSALMENLNGQNINIFIDQAQSILSAAEKEGLQGSPSYRALKSRIQKLNTPSGSSS